MSLVEWLSPATWRLLVNLEENCKYCYLKTSEARLKLLLLKAISKSNFPEITVLPNIAPRQSLYFSYLYNRVGKDRSSPFEFSSSQV